MFKKLNYPKIIKAEEELEEDMEKEEKRIKRLRK